MAEPAQDHSLDHRQYVTVVLRLTLDESGQLLQGELVDTVNQRPARFLGAAGLNQTLAAWLSGREGGTGEISLLR